MASPSRLLNLTRAVIADPRAGSRELARKLFFAVAHHFTPILAVDDGGLRLFVSTTEAFVSRQTFLTGGYEQDTMNRLVAQLPEQGRELIGRTVLEVGANIGTQTLAFLSRYGAGQVIAVEPAEDNLGLLRLNISANRLDDRVRVLALALSDEDGVGQLALSESNPGDHRVFSGAGRSAASPARETAEIVTARLDTLVVRGEVDLSALGLVWMDAQGHEGHILGGAERLLGAEVPILTEYWPHGLDEAGGLQRFHDLVAEHYTSVVDLHTDDGRPPERMPSGELPGLAARRGWTQADADVDRAFTDILLTRTASDPPR